MPFLYVYVCDLLENLGELYSCACPTLIGLERKTNERTLKWFQRHQSRLNEFSVDTQTVISFFTPQKHTDRDYGLNRERLEQLIARVLSLSRDLHAELQLWRQGPTYGDLGACVKRVVDKMAVTTQAITNKVTVEEIDQALLKIASHNPNSSPEVRALASKVKNHDAINLLENIYRRLAGKEAKWFTRLILKSYGPIIFPERLDISSNMPFLPGCIRVSGQIDISSALPMLREGAGITRGGTSAIASRAESFKRGLLTPKNGSLKKKMQDTILRSPARSDHTLAPISPSKSMGEACTVNRSKVMTDLSVRSPPQKKRKVDPGRAFADPLPTPPTTVCQPRTFATSPTRSMLNRSQPREPLAQLDSNSASSQQSIAKSLDLSSPMLLVSAAKNFPTTRLSHASLSSQNDGHRTVSISSSQLFQHRQSISPVGATLLYNPMCPQNTKPHYYRPSRRASSLVNMQGTGKCQFGTQLCPFTNCIFALSPCISDIPYISENLLSWHGCRTVTSVNALSDPSLPRNYRTGKKYRKIALVETNRLKPTEAFIIGISKLNLTSKGQKNNENKKEWVEVYDWRILEAVTKMEQGQEKGYNPWRRTWVGAV